MNATAIWNTLPLLMNALNSFHVPPTRVVAPVTACLDMSATLCDKSLVLEQQPAHVSEGGVRRKDTGRAERKTVVKAAEKKETTTTKQPRRRHAREPVKVKGSVDDNRPTRVVLLEPPTRRPVEISTSSSSSSLLMVQVKPLKR